MCDTDLSFSNPYRPLTLKNALITPKIIINSIYVLQFTNDNSCSIKFDPYGFSRKDLLTKQIIFRYDSTRDLYPVTTATHQALVSLVLLSSINALIIQDVLLFNI